MVYDHVRYFGDEALARTHFPTIDGILGFFDGRVDASGLVSGLGRRWWPFVDWVDGWTMGVPHAARDGPGTYVSLLYALSLGEAAKVATFINRHDAAQEYHTRQARLINAINTHCFDGTWYYGGPISGKPSPPSTWLSQHCQVYAVLTGAIQGRQAQDLMRRTLEDKRLFQMTLSQAFYLFRALEMTQLYELASEGWAPWRSMIAQGLDTWAETLHNPRSDCHTCSAAPLYEITAMVLGVQPAAPGFEVANVRPDPTLLDQVNGAVVTPFGLLRVKWETVRAGVPTASRSKWVKVIVEAPPGLKAILDVRGALKPEIVHFEGTFESEIQVV